MFGYEAGHEAVGNGGTDPYLNQQILGVFVDRLEIDVVVVQGSNDHVDDADGPQVALGIALPVFACIEEGEHAQQQYRQREARKMQGIIGQWRRKQDVAQQHRDAHRHRTSVVEPMSIEPIEEVHANHYQTGDVEQVEHQFGP